jgi:hypothetical protein
MKRTLLLLFTVLATFAFTAPSFAQYTNGGHDETTEDFTVAASWAATAAANPGVVASTVTGTHLLITEVGMRGLNSATLADSTEFVEIYNPTGSTISLSTFYLSDVNSYSTLPVAGTIDLAANNTDFAMRFPAGSSIAPGAAKVIAIDGGRYKRGTGVDADFMFFNAGGATTAQSMVDVATNKGATYPGFGSFTNGGEFVWLFFWNGSCDLVVDDDLVYWPTTPAAGANSPSRKLATTCQDGPDAGAATSCYFNDAGNPAGSFGRGLTVPANGAGTRQRAGSESETILSGGNGIAPLAATSTSVASDNNPSTQGSKVNFTATVTPASASGTVEFFDGATSLGTAPVIAGSATISVSTLSPGSHSITAVYGGDCSFASSTSPALKQTVIPASVPTTTTLTVDPAKTNCGDKVTLTATVTPAGATGTVTFFDFGNPIGTRPVDALGNAMLSIAGLPPGGHSFTATYSGDPTHTGSSSNKVTHEVNAFVSTTTLSQTISKTACGEKFFLTAHVDPVGATGDVEFFDNGNSLGLVPLDANSDASLSVSTLGAGVHSLTAHYHSDPCHQKSDSNKLLHEVNPVTTTLTLDAPAKLSCGDKLVLTATVNPPSSGVVTFYDNGAPIGSAPTDANGVATLSVPGGLSIGTHSLTATYSSSDPCVGGSTSNKVSHEVNPVATTTTLEVPAKLTCGEKLTLTATVSPNHPGTVTFFDGGAPIGSAPVDANGVAVLSIPGGLSIGLHSLTADYGPSDACAQPSSSNKVTHEVNPIVTTVTLDAPAKLDCGDKLVLTATVSPAYPGDVTFYDGGTPLGSAPVNAMGIATLSIPGGLSIGIHSLTATEVSSNACKQANPSNKVQHEVNAIATSTTLTTDPNPSAQDEKLTLTATVDPADASGTVNFLDGGNPIGSAPVSGGVATLSLTGLSIGVHSLTAVYKGDACHSSSTSNKVNQIIDEPVPVLLSLFLTAPVTGGVEIRWQLSASQGITSIGVERASSETGPWFAVNAERRADGEATVAVDRTAAAGRTYFYRLVVTETGGQISVFGPISGTAAAAIADFSIANVAPNPSKDRMGIDYTVPRAASVRLSVVDVLGREVAVLVGGVVEAGRYHATWNGQTERGQAPAGLYFIRYQTPGKSIMRKAVLSR